MLEIITQVDTGLKRGESHKVLTHFSGISNMRFVCWGCLTGTQEWLVWGHCTTLPWGKPSSSSSSKKWVIVSEFERKRYEFNANEETKRKYGNGLEKGQFDHLKYNFKGLFILIYIYIITVPVYGILSTLNESLIYSYILILYSFCFFLFSRCCCFVFFLFFPLHFPYYSIFPILNAEETRYCKELA